MWLFTREKHVVIIVHDIGARYLGEDLKLVETVGEALEYTSALQAASHAFSLSMSGISASATTIVVRRW